MDDSDREPPQKPLPPIGGAAPRPPVPPPAGLIRREESPLLEYMRQRMELMERELIQSRERSTASENLLKQQEALRGEVEGTLKKLTDQLRQEKTVKDLEEHKQQSEGRVESLEKRLDEMHRTWGDLLKDSLKKQESNREALVPELHAFTNSLAELREEVRKVAGEMRQVQSGITPITALNEQVSGLRISIPEASKRRSEEEATLREELRGLVDRIGEGLLGRLGEIDRRLAGDVHEHQERIEAMSRDRHALQEAIEEQQHRLRQEMIKERVALESQFNTQLAGLQDSLGSMAARLGGDSETLERLQELSRNVHAILTQPAKAKDQMITDLEAEKRDLMDALKQRTEQLRSYTLERREVERGMGESLMELNRQVEFERAKRQQDREHIASLESALQASRAELELVRREGEQKDERFRRLAEERDALAVALTEEAEKVRKQIEARTESDKRWEAKIVEFQSALNDERERRTAATQSASDLRAQVATLSDHIAKVLREQDGKEKLHADWAKEREGIEATLRKKDEMIAMLSSTFQNLLKKPSA
ncbi:MAG TPA: hypothetical protein DD417_19280 [Elusimicrobia bacterium]|nr:hypothetical protein [Elusimicrobiota bacterium]